MPTTLDLAERIQSLLEKRQEHSAAIEAIDETLGRVAGALTLNGRGHRGAASSRAGGAVGRKMGGRKRTRRRFAVSGEQAILNFVKSESNPVGREIEKHWKSEGRAGAAANLISKLVKAKRLKRTPLKGERGSRYSAA